MIVVDTSALFAILLDEPQAATCQAALQRADQAIMSAATLTEALVVASSKGLQADVLHLVERAGIEVVPLTPGRARKAGDAYRRFGKGLHPAHLNFGDCFAYALAEEHRSPLLYVGDDFARTDISAAH